MTAPRILDCTLRDGSYVVDFQFTAHDTAVIAAGLDAAGIELIEIGHGLGLHASAAGKGQAAASDEAYLRAAADSVPRAKWGTFFIPGIGRHDDLVMAAGYGMRFVRIGANAPEVETTREFVAHARRLGMEVSVNLMKSYAVPPARLVELAKAAESYGANIVSLVDSAGTMLPEDVRTYVARMCDALSVPVGFHGHDNLSLAMANALAALAAGAQVVDTTLQGIGRSGGNAVTEILVAILQKQGQAAGIDLNRMMDLSDRIVRPLLRGKGRDSLDITAGYAGFHSSYLHLVLEYASRFRIDPRALIVGVSGIDRVEVTEALVARVAGDIAGKQSASAGLHVVDLPRPASAVPDNPSATLGDAAREVARQVRAIAAKSGRLSVFNVVAASTGRSSSVSRFVQEAFEYVIGSAEIDDVAHLPGLAAAVDGVVDVFFVDADRLASHAESLAAALRPLVQQSRFASYRDNDVWVRAVEHQVCALQDGETHHAVVICGADSKAVRLAAALAERGVRVTMTAAGREELQRAADNVQQLVNRSIDDEPAPLAAVTRAGVLVAFSASSIGADVADALPAQALILDAGIGSFSQVFVARAVARGLTVVRPDMRAALAAELAAVLGSERLVRELMGRAELDGVPIVAGGLVGRSGDVVVDSIRHPARVIGVADGRGGVAGEQTDADRGRIARVEQAIWRRTVGAHASNA